MVKKSLLGLLVVLLLLASCSSKVDTSVNTSDAVVNGSVADSAKLSSDLLIKNKIGVYNFEKDSFIKNELLNGYKFNSYQAEYSFDKTTAIVSVLFSDQSSEPVNLYNFLNKTLKDNNFVFLDSEDFDYFKADVYFDPYQNMYFWLSEDKIIVIKKSIGTDLLNQYLDKYSPSVIKGSYENQEASLDFSGEKDEKIIFFNDKQYIIELLDFNRNKNFVQFSVNGEKGFFEKDDGFVLGNLLMTMTSVDFDAQKAVMRVEGEVFEKVSYTINLGESVTFSMNKKSNTLKLTGVNSNDKSAIINLNGQVNSVSIKEVMLVDGFDVKLDDLLISDLGDAQVIAKISVWYQE